MSPTKRTIRLAVGFLLLGIGIGFTVPWAFFVQETASRGHALRIDNPAFPLIQPLLACGVDSQIPSSELDSLRSLLQDAVDRAVAAGSIQKAGVYVRDLNGGTWTAVNGDDEYIPGSLMKIITLIGYINESENNPTILDEVLTVDPSYKASPQNIPPAVSAESGKQYTVAELLTIMITYSDNVASHTLIEHMKAEELNGLLNALELPSFSDEEHYTITPRLYSRLLRVLHNSTLLTAQDSERILEMLSRSDYRDALVSGVDATEAVAHKFGDVTLANPDGTTAYQHHDCGIVYAKNPYLICVMTEGNDLQTLASTIASFATTTDTFMNSR
ncbi:MAG: serine hydrolase [Patescibacteria group bacterium]